MPKTLYEVVKQVESSYDLISQYTAVDKKDGLKRVFEEWKGNPIVRAVLEGRTTFADEYRKTFGEYGFKKLLLPFSLPQGFKERVADLETCIGYSGLDNSVDTQLTNPLGLGALFSAAVAIPSALILAKSPQKISRRRFIIEGAIIGAMSGGIIGGLASYKTKSILDDRYRAATYLDEIYMKFYKK